MEYIGRTYVLACFPDRKYKVVNAYWDGTEKQITHVLYESDIGWNIEHYKETYDEDGTVKHSSHRGSKMILPLSSLDPSKRYLWHYVPTIKFQKERKVI